MSYASLFPLPSSPRIIPGFTSSTTISNGTRSTPSWIAWPSTLFRSFGPYSRIGSARAWSPSVRISPITPRKWSAWKWVKKISDKAKLTPYRIIWRWVPSPHSNSSVSPSRTRATPETFRSTVGRAADVPRNVTESMGPNISVASLSHRPLPEDSHVPRPPPADSSAGVHRRSRPRCARASRLGSRQPRHRLRPLPGLLPVRQRRLAGPHRVGPRVRELRQLHGADRAEQRDAAQHRGPARCGGARHAQDDRAEARRLLCVVHGFCQGRAGRRGAAQERARPHRRDRVASGLGAGARPRTPPRLGAAVQRRRLARLQEQHCDGHHRVAGRPRPPRPRLLPTL